MRLEQLKGWKWSHLSVVGTYNLVVMHGLTAPCQFRAISTITDPSLQRRLHSFVQRRDELEARSADVEKTCVSSQNELQAPLGAHRFFFSRRQVVEEKPAWYFALTEQSQMSLLILETLLFFTIVPTMSRQISSLRSP